MHKYDDIINYDYHMKHPRMTMNNRAYEFAPFSALSGYSEMIREVTREVETKIELDNDVQEEISKTINQINQDIKNRPLVAIKYFIKDKKKKGGNYVTTINNVRTIDFANKKIILMNKEIINILDIIDIKIKKKMDY